MHLNLVGKNLKFPVRRLTFATPDFYEQLGTKEKFWIKWRNDRHRYLFKFSRENTGEHWSEKVAEQLCDCLDIPHAEYELSVIKRPDSEEYRVGVLSKNIVPENWNMIMGNEFLYNYAPEVYPKADGCIKHIQEHTIDMVYSAFNEHSLKKPPACLLGIDAWGIFCGYLMLDALISNQDRHHENWAVLRDNENHIYLCPSYDHAASLGRELSDENRQTRLNTKDNKHSVPFFVKRARSELFENTTDKKPLKTTEAFYLASSKQPDIKEFWCKKLSLITPDFIDSLFEKFPSGFISEQAKKFAKSVIIENKKRILNDE